MSKPQLILFKMFNCGHCTTMVEKPTPQTSTWGKLSSDPELKSKVDLILIEWGMNAGKRYPLPEKYKFVNYGPYIYLRPPQGSSPEAELKNAANGIEFKGGNGYDRTTPSLKKWIIDTLATQPKLSVVNARPQPSRPQGQMAANHRVQNRNTQTQNVPLKDRMTMREKRKAAQKGGFVETQKPRPLSQPHQMPQKLNNFLKTEPQKAPVQNSTPNVRSNKTRSAAPIQVESSQPQIVSDNQNRLLSEVEQVKPEVPRQRKIRYRARAKK